MITAMDERMLGAYRFLFSDEDYLKEGTDAVIRIGDDQGLDGLVAHLDIELVQRDTLVEVPDWMQAIVDNSVEREIERAILGLTMGTDNPHHARRVLTYTNKLLYHSARLGFSIKRRAAQYGGITQEDLKAVFRLYAKERIADNAVLGRYDVAQGLMADMDIRYDEVLADLERRNFGKISKWEKRGILRRFKRGVSRDISYDQIEGTHWPEIASSVLRYVHARQTVVAGVSKQLDRKWYTRKEEVEMALRKCLEHVVYSLDDADVLLDVAVNLAKEQKLELAKVWEQRYEERVGKRLGEIGSPVEQKLLGELTDRQITFAEFMGTAMYDQEFGFYTQSRLLVDETHGEFRTCPHTYEDFGYLLAHDLFDRWVALGKPDEFKVVEVGAGEGKMAKDILDEAFRNSSTGTDGWSDFVAAIKYEIIELNEQLRERQEKALRPYTEKDTLTIKCGSALELPYEDDSVVGCFISNELPDAFPVHKVVRRGDELREIYVTSNGHALVEVEGALSTPVIQQYVNDLEVELLQGQEVYVNLGIDKWVSEIGRVLKRGHVITVDYGHCEDYLFGGPFQALRTYGRIIERERRGFSELYGEQGKFLESASFNLNPLVHPGEKDITVDVDFTRISRVGQRHGFEAERLLTQKEYFRDVAERSNYRLPRRMLLYDGDAFYVHIMKK